MGNIDVTQSIEEIECMLKAQIEEREQGRFSFSSDLDQTGMWLLFGAQNVWSYGLKEKGSTTVLFSVQATSKRQPLDWSVIISEWRNYGRVAEPPEDSGWLIIASRNDSSSSISWGGDESFQSLLEDLADGIANAITTHHPRNPAL